jgi:hypothetical protein
MVVCGGRRTNSGDVFRGVEKISGETSSCLRHYKEKVAGAAFFGAVKVGVFFVECFFFFVKMCMFCVCRE